MSATKKCPVPGTENPAPGLPSLSLVATELSTPIIGIEPNGGSTYIYAPMQLYCVRTCNDTRSLLPMCHFHS